ncbi:MAG: flagellin [Oscillospiraceae bacterium]|nr:flagellin [Oscillospiraceae bacterium]
MRIQHNIMAMNAYRNYNTNTSALSKNLEKLSSGYKINRAGDDAAGLAISEKMRAQITGLNAAQKNVKDGISLVKTAEGAMQEIQDMLNRMDYLATQSANGTYDDPVDRKNLNKEMLALKDEINRIADSANFNGIKLLNGDLADNTVAASTGSDTHNNIVDISSACGQLHKAGVAEQAPSFQIDLKQAISGAKASATIAANASFSLKVTVGGATVTVKVTAQATIAKGALISNSKVTFATAATATSAMVTGGGGVGSSTKFNLSVDNGVLKFSFATASGAVVKNFNSNLSVSITAGSGVTLSVGSGAANGPGPVSFNCQTQNVKNGVAEAADQLAHGHVNITQDMADALAKGGKLTLGDVTVSFDAETSNTTASTVGIKDLLNDDGTVKSDKLAELTRRITVAAANSNTFTVGVGTSGTTLSLEEKYDYRDKDDESTYIDTEEQFNAKVYYTEPTSTAASGTNNGLVLQIGDTSDTFNRLTVSIKDMHVSAMGKGKLNEGTKDEKIITQSIEDISITTASNAKEAIDVIKNAINYVSEVRGDLGAIQNRLEHTANNLSVMAENIQDAESTIRDTDVAEEMMAYTKNNILVQSAQAMLAQANAVPQGVLQLLG